MLRKRKNNQRGIAAVLIVLLATSVLGGCGTTAQVKAPQLKESPSNSKKTYTVTRRDIKDLQTSLACVSAARVCATAQADGVISELVKPLGATVKKGEVIARIVSDEIQTEYDAQLKLSQSEQKQHTINVQIYQLQKQKKQAQMEYLKASYDETNPEETARQIALCQAQIAEINHSISYENQLYQMNASLRQKQVDALAEELSANEIVSPCNGMLTYYDDVSVGSSVQVGDAVAIVLNTDKKVIQSAESTSFGDDVDSIKLYYLDKEYELTRYVYTAKEKQMLAKADMEELECYTFDGIDDMELGTLGYMVVQKNTKNQVLAVPTGAVKQDKTQKIVYVKTDTDTKKTVVETGVSTDSYVEITSGLSEGDVISYTEYDGVDTDSLLDADSLTDDYGVGKQTTQKVAKDSLTYQTIDENDYSYCPASISMITDTSGNSGTFVEMKVKVNDTVNVGDVIAVVDYGVTQADKLEAANAVREANAQIQKETASYQKEAAALKKQIMKATEVYEQKQLQCDLEILKLTHQLNSEQNQQQLSEAKENQSELNEKAAGVIRSTCAGTVNSVDGYDNLVKGDTLTSGTPICQIEDWSSVYVTSSFGWDYYPGMQVTVRTSSGKEVAGVVVSESYSLGFLEEDNVGNNVYYDDTSLRIEMQGEVDVDDRPSRLTVKQNILRDVPVVSSDAVSYNWNGDASQTQWYVLVKQSDGTYDKRVVSGQFVDSSLWILDGLEVGEEVGYTYYVPNYVPNGEEDTDTESE
jgi:multidrug efflux pump subunit AcrA (membrane-fusion protein)